MRILIIGSGAVGNILYRNLRKQYNKANIFISDYKKEINYKQSIFGPNTLYYRKGVGGLGKYWHGVMDVDLVKSLGTIEKTSYFNKFDLLDENNTEYVPYLVPRYTNKKNVIDPVSEIINVSNSYVEIKNVYGKKDKYDYVFAAIGIGIKDTDPLIKSNICKENKYISDHIIFNSYQYIKKRQYIKNTFDGHYRKYNVLNLNGMEIKESFRPSLSKSMSDPRNKAIYADNKINIIKNLFKNGFISPVLTSVHLRYGLMSLSSFGNNFYQMKVDNLYELNKDGKLILNYESIHNSEINRIFKYLKINKDTLLSGIHLHNSYSDIISDNNISVNEYKQTNTTLRIISPNIKFSSDYRHFTSYFMRLAEIMSNNLE